mmetsp:Transcript_10011/g.29520  ORF Transcript_10011/g.29520 Transcript_10011/m.29520 type:complete len:604 (-) Transcript_10011:5390-7201(-)
MATRRPVPLKRQCRVDGCERRILSKGLCGSHGGGSRCTKEGCDKFDAGGGFCVRHGGGRRCSFPVCPKGAQPGRLFCRAHDKPATVPDDRRSGALCVSHTAWAQPGYFSFSGPYLQRTLAQGGSPSSMPPYAGNGQHMQGMAGQDHTSPAPPSSGIDGRHVVMTHRGPDDASRAKSPALSADLAGVNVATLAGRHSPAPHSMMPEDAVGMDMLTTAAAAMSRGLPVPRQEPEQQPSSQPHPPPPPTATGYPPQAPTRGQAPAPPPYEDNVLLAPPLLRPPPLSVAGAAVPSTSAAMISTSGTPPMATRSPPPASLVECSLPPPSLVEARSMGTSSAAASVLAVNTRPTIEVHPPVALPGAAAVPPPPLGLTEWLMKAPLQDLQAARQTGALASFAQLAGVVAHGILEAARLPIPSAVAIVSPLGALPKPGAAQAKASVSNGDKTQGAYQPRNDVQVFPKEGESCCSSKASSKSNPAPPARGRSRASPSAPETGRGKRQESGGGGGCCGGGGGSNRRSSSKGASKKGPKRARTSMREDVPAGHTVTTDHAGDSSPLGLYIDNSEVMEEAMRLIMDGCGMAGGGVCTCDDTCACANCPEHNPQVA